MTAAVGDVGAAGDPRIELQQDTDDFRGEYADYRESLRLTRERPQHSWYAAAYDDRAGRASRNDRRFAGHAWSHLRGETETAGVFDMQVWPQFQRRGLGSGLLRAVVAAAAGAGASNAVLNATQAVVRVLRLPSDRGRDHVVAAPFRAPMTWQRAL